MTSTHLIRLGVGAVLVATASLASAPSAQASYKSVPDPAGDVRGFTPSPDPAPCGSQVDVDPTGVANVDITRLSVRHSRDDVTVVVRLDDVVPGQLRLEVPLLTPSGDYAITVDRAASGRTSREFVPHLDRDQQQAAAHADGCTYSFAYSSGGCEPKLDISAAKDTITLVESRACLKNPRWVRVGASTDLIRDDGGHHYSYFDDHWGGKPWKRYGVTYGPRMPAAPDRRR